MQTGSWFRCCRKPISLMVFLGLILSTLSVLAASKREIVVQNYAWGDNIKAFGELVPEGIPVYTEKAVQWYRKKNDSGAFGPLKGVGMWYGFSGGRFSALYGGSGQASVLKSYLMEKYGTPYQDYYEQFDFGGEKYVTKWQKGDTYAALVVNQFGGAEFLIESLSLMK